jgi:Putative prokaryotic signal transducing protein
VVLTDPNAYVMLRRFLDLEQALAAKALLDSLGIDSYLADEHTIRMMISNLGGVRLFVRRSDAETAATLLDQADPQNS